MAKLYEESFDVSEKLLRRIYNLDKRNLFFLSEFTDEQGNIDSYSIDVESACDSHYEMDFKNAMRLAAFFGNPNCSTIEFADALTGFFTGNGEGELVTLMMNVGIGFMHFHFGH